MSEPNHTLEQRNDCPECGHQKAAHHVEYNSETGDPEDAWFECPRCDHKWSCHELSERLLGLKGAEAGGN